MLYLSTVVLKVPEVPGVPEVLVPGVPGVPEVLVPGVLVPEVVRSRGALSPLRMGCQVTP